VDRQLRVAIVGAGPAGIYAADILTKSDADVTVDIIDRLPTPYGLVRYGVAPDHPRIKEIIKALRNVLANPDIRFVGNVDFGTDVKLDELRRWYDAVIFATGARYDRGLDIPGIDLPGSFGAADFVSWFDAHPDVPLTWPLEAKEVAIFGAGNVALDVARILAKTADELLVTEIPDHVYQGLAVNQATDVHIFARRGPAQIKFSPLELRELGHSPAVEVIVHTEGFDFDEGSMTAIRSSKQTKTVVDTLQNWAAKEPEGKAHRIHLHFLEGPVAVLGDDHVTGVRTERTELTGDGNVRGTGETTDWPVQAVYRAVGYLSSALPDVPFDDADGVVPNIAGRVTDLDGQHIPGTYVTGWIKRGPVGLIGHTKSDATETIKCLLEDLPALIAAEQPERDALLNHLAANAVEFTTTSGWEKLDAHEMSLGEPHGRLRIKVGARDEMVRISNG
jgi:ferredoxin--NADP+ reductase